MNDKDRRKAKKRKGKVFVSGGGEKKAKTT